MSKFQKHSWHILLMNFWSSLKNCGRHFIWNLVSRCIKEILYVNVYFNGKKDGIKGKINTFPLVSYVNVEEFMCEFYDHTSYILIIKKLLSIQYSLTDIS